MSNRVENKSDFQSQWNQWNQGNNFNNADIQPMDTSDDYPISSQFGFGKKGKKGKKGKNGNKRHSANRTIKTIRKEKKTPMNHTIVFQSLSGLDRVRQQILNDRITELGNVYTCKWSKGSKGSKGSKHREIRCEFDGFQSGNPGACGGPQQFVHFQTKNEAISFARTLARSQFICKISYMRYSKSQKKSVDHMVIKI